MKMEQAMLLTLFSYSVSLMRFQASSADTQKRVYLQDIITI
jgi:hypothetical protein